MIEEIIDIMKMTEIEDYAEISALGITQAEYELVNKSAKATMANLRSKLI